MSDGYVKLASHSEIQAYNDTFIENVRMGNIKEASVSAQAFTRNVIRENSFAEKILTPIHITNDELDKTENPELLVKWNDREPDTAPAVSVPYGVVPDGLEFRGDRYPSYFGRIMSPKKRKDFDHLRGYDYDIRQVLMEIDTKQIATEIDTKFMGVVNSVIGSANTANPLNGRSLPQWIQISGGINRDNLKEAFKHIQRLKVPFGPAQPDGEESKGIILANNITANDLNAIPRSEIGDDEAKRTWIEGLPSGRILGVNTAYTIKEDLVPESTIYLFSSEEFLGKYYKLYDLVCFMKNEAFFLEWFQYLNLSIAIGNVRGVVRVDFV